LPFQAGLRFQSRDPVFLRPLLFSPLVSTKIRNFEVQGKRVTRINQAGMGVSPASVLMFISYRIIYFHQSTVSHG
jgi:hypothetical protein